jgi:protein-tyrosine phosphatase
MKILMVCLGNICRSPMAHGLLEYKAKALGLNWQIDSAGTSGWHRGDLPDARAVACMKKHGIDITYQSSRPIIPADLQEYDLVYVMDRSNQINVLEIAKTEEEQHKVALIMSMVNEHEPADVPDPYFGTGDKGFETVYKMLDEATNKIIAKYR